jgi:uncharacterized protein YdeI (YjbR/CyaY-like superfamily)
MSIDTRIDAYIKKTAPFAQPILEHIRKVVHKACPEVKETMKWGFPHFEHKGIICSMASFKKHASFGFWKGSVMKDSNQLLTVMGDTDMARFDKLTSVEDLPSDKILIAYIKEAVRLNEEGIKLPTKEKSKRMEIPMPEELSAALRRNKKALITYEQLSPSHKREYLEWITEAKTEATREKRLDTTIEWLAEGKSMHWKYQAK